MMATMVLTAAISLMLLNFASSSYFSSLNRYSLIVVHLKNFTKSLSATNSLFPCLVSLFVGLLLMNVLGNIPGLMTPSMFYWFSASISLSLWLALMVVVWKTQLISFTAHMMPYGAPMALGAILPLIEIFSQIIRPFTLMIRLSTNLAAGHIMLYMFSYFAVSSLSLVAPISLVLIVLILLETMISALQAYIFTSLVVMYNSETL